MAQGVQFTKDSAVRVSKAVRKSEAEGPNLAPYRRRHKGGSHALRAIRFELTTADATHLDVGDGNWTRRAEKLAWTSSGDDVVVGGGGDGRYYIYAELDRVGDDKDPALLPDALLMQVSNVDAEPTQIVSNTTMVIGYVDVSGGVAGTPVQFWGWDIDNFAIVPDAATISAASPVLSTIRYYGVDDTHEGELGLYASEGAWSGQYRIPYLPKVGGDGALTWAVFDADLGGNEQGTQLSIQFKSSVWQLWNFDDATSSGEISELNDFVLIRDDTGPELKYADASDLAQWIINEVVKIINEEKVILHAALDWDPDDNGVAGQNGDHDERYWIKGENYVECYGGSIGNNVGGEAIIIDLDGKQLEDGNGNPVVDWNTLQLATGPWTVTDATDVDPGTPGTAAFQIAGGLDVTKSIQCDKFYIHDRVANTWDSATLVVDVTGAIDWEAGTTVDIDAAGIIDIESGADLTMSAIDAASITTTNGDVTLTSGAWINLDAASVLHLNPTGDLQINDNVGNTLADGGNNLFEKGIFVNDAPAYAIFGARLVPSGGGPPVNMNVIARAI